MKRKGGGGNFERNIKEMFTGKRERLKDWVDKSSGHGLKRSDGEDRRGGKVRMRGRGATGGTLRFTILINL